MSSASRILATLKALPRDSQPITIVVCGTSGEIAGETVKSCAMVITDANDFVAEVHDRMPVILEPDQFEPWLLGSAGVELLKPAGTDVFQRWPVSKRVNSSRASDEDATLIDPLPTNPNVTFGASDLFTSS